MGGDERYWLCVVGGDEMEMTMTMGDGERGRDIYISIYAWVRREGKRVGCQGGGGGGICKIIMVYAPALSGI